MWIAKALLGLSCPVASMGVLNAQAGPVQSPPQHDSRIFGILPNYRTIPDTLEHVEPLSSGEKWKLATMESFDPASFLLAGALAGLGQREHQFPSWGQGAKGYSRRFGAAVADQVVGDYLTGAIFPVLLHQDPRYFRTGHGTLFRRIRYAVGRIAITRTDAGSNQANYSEFLGNAVAAGIANVYIPAADRTVGDTAQKLGMQLATDAFFNVLKEFWPDIHHKLHVGQVPDLPESH
jgi:hypothetical protein